MATQQKLITIVDYGMGNLRSVAKATEHVAPANSQVIISNQVADIHNADSVIFPGQGAAKACMKALDNSGLEQALIEAAHSKPFLGICMGLQVLMQHSQENDGVNCLNIIEGDVVRFNPKDNELKIPHMGWNQVHQTQAHPLWHKIPQDARFYFVHSYFVQPVNPNITVGITEHGQTFSAAVAQGNIFAIQAHPEKSADCGLQLLKNFTNWSGQ